jgi:hypothetical protein
LKDNDLNDEMELLLMELTIRKDILEDVKDKVYHILGIETWRKKNVIYDIDLGFLGI